MSSKSKVTKATKSKKPAVKSVDQVGSTFCDKPADLDPTLDFNKIKMIEFSQEKGENVKVVVRSRPLNKLEGRTAQTVAWDVDPSNSSIVQLDLRNEAKKASDARMSKDSTLHLHNYVFDAVYEPNMNNSYIYASMGRQIISSLMDGYHGCMFAYGQTSSGKTHTMKGTTIQHGMIGFCVEDIFQYIEECIDREFLLRCSYIEIYNEQVNDLFNPTGAENLKIREDKEKGIFVQNLKEEIVVNAGQVFSLISAGESHRHVGRTNYNEISSRSHTIFRIVVESKPRSTESRKVRMSTLNLIDLAGSENAKKAGTSERIKESSYINKSLLALGTVIWKLSEGQYEHINFRDSKLTRILQTSLSGNSRIAVICCMSPSSGNVEETISTLKFAQRAKSIKQDANINEGLDDKALLRHYRLEIEKLKKELDESRQAYKKICGGGDVDIKTLQQEIEQNSADKAALEARIERLSKLILVSSHVTEEELEKNLENTEEKFDSSRDNILRRKPSSRARYLTFTPGMFSDFKKMKHAGLMDAFDEQEDLKIDEEDENDDFTTSAGLLAITSPCKKTVSELTQQVIELQELLRQRVKDLENLNNENNNLKTEIEEKDELLSEWDDFYSKSQNENRSLREALARYTGKSIPSVIERKKPEFKDDSEDFATISDFGDLENLA